jgi:hypothetical protein
MESDSLQILQGESGIDARLEISVGRTETLSGNKIDVKIFVTPDQQAEFHIYVFESGGRGRGVYSILSRAQFSELREVVLKADRIFLKCRPTASNDSP